MAKEKASIVIRKEEVVEGGHHGGAWKVAYADFVTAMMAFFLLMWLLNATTEQQKRGIADYFSPHNDLSQGTSGYGGPFGGRTVNSVGSLASDNGAVQALNAPRMPNVIMEDDDSGDISAETPVTRFQTGGGEQASTNDGKAPQEAAVPADGTKPDVAQPGAGGRAAVRSPTDADLTAELQKREKTAFDRAAQQIRDAVASDPALSDLARQLMIDVTPDGLRIQLVDADKQPMFATGSAALNERARAVLAKITPVLMRLPEQVSITGHTDGTPYKGQDRTNWDLSVDRANVTRRLLTEAGLPEARIRSVSGMADRDHLITTDPLAAANRRISIVVLRELPVGKLGAKPSDGG
jgi:chemotaxis protein MotB